MTVKTVGELIEKLQELSPDTKILTQSSNSMEIGSELVIGSYVRVGKYSPKEKHCRDAFDGTNYTTTVYRTDEEGEDCVVI